MGDKTKIEWTDATWPVVTGCTPVSAGCENCYAARVASGRLKNHPRYAGLAEHGKWTGEVRCNADALDQPLHWRKPRNVFVASMGDLFHPEVPFKFINEVFSVMESEHQHDFQILTKRPWRMERFMTSARSFVFPLNVWMGTSGENQKAVDKRCPWLVGVCPRSFLSLEPLLGPVDLTSYIRRLRGVIVGGETGPNARPMHPDWVRSIRDQCAEAGVPFFLKQMSGKTKMQREAIPDDLMIRQTPWLWQAK